MERKVTKVGNSLGITMTEALKQIGVESGDNVQIEVRDDEIIIKKSRKVQLPQGLNPNFFEALKYTMDRYDGTLKGLKDR